MINLNIYPTYFQNESKMLKVTMSLAEAKLFEEINIVGLYKDGLAEHETIEYHRKVWRVKRQINFNFPIIRGIINVLEWYFKIFFRFRNIKNGVIHCNCIEDLPLAIFFKLVKKNITVVYDTRELETEKNGLNGYHKTIAKLLERLFIKKVDAVMVVSPSIRKWYEYQYKLKNIFLIKNMPEKVQISEPINSRFFKNHFKINNGMIFLYHGCFNKGRGIDIILDVFKNMAKDKHVIFMGYGNLKNKITDYANKHENIHYMDAVSPERVLEYASGADVGLSIFENICLSHYYVLPNKLFEYLLSGLPVIVSNFPDMSEVVDKYDNGWKVEPYYDQLFDLINSITKEDIEKKKKNVLISQHDIGWESQEKILVDMYKKILQ